MPNENAGGKLPEDRWLHLGELESGLGGPFVNAGAVVEQPSRVKHPEHGPHGCATDEAVATEVVHLLNLNPAVVASGLTVMAACGEVTLRGAVPDADMREAAERIAREVDGVKKVTNHLRIEHTSLETRHRR